MTYNDDEPILRSSNVSGRKPVPFIAGSTKLTVINKYEAPLEETDFTVLLKLTEPDYAEDRIPVDFVTVLDVSRSMNEEDKIGKLKTAMQFLVKKLSPIDRLSVVTFSWSSRRLFPLRQITDESREDIINKVNALKAGGLTNTAAGLKMGLEVLNDRRLKDGRIGVIMLISDGEQTLQLGDARRVDQIDKFPVHTFSLGKPKVLHDIADRSNGGTYSDVGSGNHLSIAFSQCLVGLMILTVQDLKLTITPVDGESDIKAVSAGNYPQIMNDDGSITISLGDLYCEELRRVLVDLVLPAVECRHASDVLQVTYTYRAGKEERPFVAPSLFVTITRTDIAGDKEREKATLEENRLKTANMVKEASALAYNELEAAKDKVVETQNSLEGAQINNEPYNELIEKLKHELQQLLDLMRTQKLYEQKGHSDAMYFEASHDRQRYGASGDRAEMRSFATPRMNAYHEQAKESEDGVEEECIAEEESEESLSEEECLTEEDIAEEESEEHRSEEEHIAEEESEERTAEEESEDRIAEKEHPEEEESEERIAEEEREDRIAEKEHPEEEESEERIAEEESEEHIAEEESEEHRSEEEHIAEEESEDRIAEKEHPEEEESEERVAEEESEEHLSEEEHIAEEESTEHLSKEDRNAEKERIGKEKRIAEEESEEHLSEEERIPKVRSFTIPTNAYLKPPPSAEDDETKEILDDPTIPYYIKLANLLSKSAGRAIKSSTPRT